jgi:hypothetical protein
MPQDTPKTIFFHVGLARAASTYLQHKVFPHLQGVHYIPPQHYRRAPHLIAATTAPTYLVSREFDQRLAWAAQQWAHVFPETRIILVLRRPDRWIASRYRQFVKNGNSLRFPEFFDIAHDTGYWKRQEASMWAKIRIIEQYFPQKPLVLLLDDLVATPYAFLDQLAQFIGCTYDKARISLRPYHTSYSDKQLQVMLRVGKGVFALDPSYDQGARWVQWVAQRARLVACYGILYPAVLVPASWVARQPLIAPELLAQIHDFFAEDWHRCQAYARQQPGASSAVGDDAPTGPAHPQDGPTGPDSQA